jgi:hypothetical protein
MRINDVDGVAMPQRQWVVLDRDEAWHLKLSLDYYFDEDEIDPGWHMHIGSDSEQLTIAIEPDPSDS